MNKKAEKRFQSIVGEGVSGTHRSMMERELQQGGRHILPRPAERIPGLYEHSDLYVFPGFPPLHAITASLQTLDELLERDKKREEDGFPRRIRIGKFIKPGKDKPEKVVVVPTTTEPKLYHVPDSDEEETSTGGTGEGEEGDVIGEQQADPQEGEGEGTGAGQGGDTSHDISSDAFDLGRVLTEQFELPNLKVKGKKTSFTKFKYDLTDRNRGFGQVLDKKQTLKKIIETNILLGNIKDGEAPDPEKFVINPRDRIYRILSKEKDLEAQAVVFFIRDYSGSMQGKPTEAVVTQHLLIYSWLMYQYQRQVQVRFILHDTEAKEVTDFYTYYRSAVAGGTSVFPSYEMVYDIIVREQLARENNIYIFHGTDGDDWEEQGEKAIEQVKLLLPLISRMGVTVAKNSWTQADAPTVVEKYFDASGLLKSQPALLRLDAFAAETATEERLIEGIRLLTA